MGYDSLLRQVKRGGGSSGAIGGGLPTPPSAGNLIVGSGTLWVSRALSGDATISSTGVLTLGSVIAAGGPTGDATHVAQVTYDAKGRLTAVTSVAIAASTLAGPMGPPGQAAEDGEPGPPGRTGDTGATGAAGAAGVAGAPGIGLAGDEGEAGVMGPPGRDGAAGGQGVIGPPGADSDDADAFIVGIPSTGVVAGSYGTSTAIPALTIGSDGRVSTATSTSINYAPIAGGTDDDPVNYWYMAEPADVGAVTTSAITSVTATTSGTVSAYSDSTGVYTDHQGATSGTPVGWASSAVILDGQNLPKSWFKLKTGTDISSQRIWVGWTDGTSTANVNTDTPGSSQARSGAAFRYSTVAGDTVWQCVTFNGTSETVTSSGITVSADTRYDFAIDFVNRLAGSANILFYINGTLVVTATATLPDAAIQMFLLTQLVPQVSVARHLRVAKWHVVGQSTRNAIGTATGLYLGTDSATSTLAPTNVNIYLDIAFVTAVTATIGTVQRRLPISVTATQIVFLLSAALANGQSAALRFNINGTGDSTLRADFGTPGVATDTLIATASGNLTNGVYSYKTTFVINGFENAPSAASANVTVDGTHKQITVGNITTGPTGTTARKVYRTTAGGASYLLLTTVADNTTTTYTDNVADASLGAAVGTGLVVGSAIGALAMAQDDLVVFEAFSFSGATTFTMKNTGFAYRTAATDGALFGRGTWDPTSINSATSALWGGFGNATAALAAAWVQKQVTIGNVSMVANAAPGAGKSYTLQVQKNDASAVSIGGLASLAGTGTSSNTLNINANPPVTTTFAAADDFFFLKGTTGSPASTTLREMFSYRVAAPDQGVHWFSTGRNGFNMGTLTGTVYFAFGYFGAAITTSTESSWRVPWPCAGTFKYFGAKIAGVTGTIKLRVNGADSALSLTVDGAAHQDLSTTVHVSVGDLVDLSVTQTSGTSGSFTMQGVDIGFLPD